MCHVPPARLLNCCRSPRSAAWSERDPGRARDSRYWRQSSLGPGAALAPLDDCWPTEWLGVGLAVGSLLAVPSTPFCPGWLVCGAALVAPELRPSTPGGPLPAENTPASAMPPTITTAAAPPAAPTSARDRQRPRRGGRRWAWRGRGRATTCGPG